MINIQKFNCRYILPHKNVYVVARDPMPLYRSRILSVQFSNTQAIIGHEEKLYAQNMADVLTNSKKTCHVVESTPIDLMYVSGLLKMPFIVITNSYCDWETKEETFEIYYNKYQQNVPKFTL